MRQILITFKKNLLSEKITLKTVQKRRKKHKCPQIKNPNSETKPKLRKGVKEKLEEKTKIEKDVFRI